MRLFLFIVFSISSLHVIAQENKQPLLKVGIIADVQYCDEENKGTRYYRLSVSKLKNAITHFRSEEVDFIINLGDFIDRDFENFEPILNIFTQIDVPVYNVLGNHDFSVEEDQKEKVPPILGLEKRYYSFSRFNWKFIFLDGNDISLYANDKGSDKYEIARLMLDSLKGKNAANAHEWNGAIGKSQAEWISQQLSQARKSGENIILLSHFPVFPLNDHENLWNSLEIKNLIEQFSGKIVFLNGHTHRSSLNFSNNVCYVSFRGMVEETENSFAILEVYNDSLIINGFGAEESHQINWE